MMGCSHDIEYKAQLIVELGSLAKSIIARSHRKIPQKKETSSILAVPCISIASHPFILSC
jgi:hypothetical protein